ncbi:hypothetical protein ACIQM0_22465 [Streptomyces sp. NPDC091387]|uniref:hypothetical protein n=1 Tax=Streptomyces sp. NPDC091387 TaxID=3365998 RepID=UPI003825F9D9
MRARREVAPEDAHCRNGSRRVAGIFRQAVALRTEEYPAAQDRAPVSADPPEPVHT